MKSSGPSESPARDSDRVFSPPHESALNQTTKVCSTVPVTQTRFVIFDAAVDQEREQWLDLWHRWPDHEVWAHPGYVQLFSRPSDRALCACLDEKSGGILFPLIVRPISAEPWAFEDQTSCDLVSPYGYGGPFGWGATDTPLFWKCFDEWAQAIHAVSLCTRFLGRIDQTIPFVGETAAKGSSIVVLLNQDAEAIWNGYNSSIRRNIKAAERAGILVVSDPRCERLDEFLTVYYRTMDRVGALSKYYFHRNTFFRKLIAQLPEHVVLFHALHQNRVVSSELVLLSPRSVYSFLGGTLPECFPTRADQLLRHAINMWGKEQGKERVVLGGGYAAAIDSLYQYKKKFSVTEIPFSLGSRIFDPDRYNSLVQARREWEMGKGNEWCPTRGFFPLYRD
jgi:GNAT acetyltransferase-like protein